MSVAKILTDFTRQIINVFEDRSLVFKNELSERQHMSIETQKKNMQPKHAAEFLKLINDEPDLDKQKALLEKHATKIPLSMLLSLNFNDRLKLDLPEGTPPFKRDEQTHPDLMTPLSTQVTRLKACLKENNLPKFKKEQVFIQVVEMIPPCDADVVVACKDKALAELYPNITKELVESVFPNYVK